MNELLRERTVCPICRADLTWDGAVTCSSCGRTYSVDDGIVSFVVDDDEQKRRQAAFFDDDADAEYEIRRPHGTPPFYSWLLSEKLRRSISALRDVVAGGTVLTVCGGSGMEAEFLSRRGAHVVSADISAGAAARARERARRFGVEVTPVVADAERLPFRDRSFDLVYVHDGLHHIDRPFAGLAEMARVARRAVSVNEPARAAVTAAAVRAGLALEREDAGNAVARLDVDEVADALAAHGFDVVVARRYPMFYRHEPGRISRILSTPAVAPAAKAVYRGASRAAAPIGNKLTVQAVRR